MITISIAWALVLVLFNLKFERADERNETLQGKRQAVRNLDWALWLAVFSPVIGVSLGALGAFVLTH